MIFGLSMRAAANFSRLWSRASFSIGTLSVHVDVKLIVKVIKVICCTIITMAFTPVMNVFKRLITTITFNLHAACIAEMQ